MGLTPLCLKLNGKRAFEESTYLPSMNNYTAMPRVCKEFTVTVSFKHESKTLIKKDDEDLQCAAPFRSYLSQSMGPVIPCSRNL
ncbi:unnamed protein product [Parnassius apollo]|uniref:(apollo) hypothetical protein n=1 Tax=Parnassius apollo TaxID=110799 RepID=A0A8S3X8L9_PARAO|nr:unnamed protein product [Parnassius apollo]